MFLTCRTSTCTYVLVHKTQSARFEKFISTQNDLSRHWQIGNKKCQENISTHSFLFRCFHLRRGLHATHIRRNNVKLWQIKNKIRELFFYLHMVCTGAQPQNWLRSQTDRSEKQRKMVVSRLINSIIIYFLTTHTSSRIHNWNKQKNYCYFHSKSDWTRAESEAVGGIRSNEFKHQFNSIWFRFFFIFSLICVGLISNSNGI